MAVLTTVGRVRDAARAAGLDPDKTLSICATFLGFTSDDTEALVPDDLVRLLGDKGAILPGSGVIMIGGDGP